MVMNSETMNRSFDGPTESGQLAREKSLNHFSPYSPIKRFLPTCSFKKLWRCQIRHPWLGVGSSKPCSAMSKAQLTAFMVKVDADTALRARVEAAGSVDAVVAIALEQGHAFSPASWSRAQRS
jgi:predicted ribosomally synthesized peptide with nif11-like leader